MPKRQPRTKIGRFKDSFSWFKRKDTDKFEDARDVSSDDDEFLDAHDKVIAPVDELKRLQLQVSGSTSTPKGSRSGKRWRKGHKGGANRNHQGGRNEAPCSTNGQQPSVGPSKEHSLVNMPPHNAAPTASYLIK